MGCWGWWWKDRPAPVCAQRHDCAPGKQAGEGGRRGHRGGDGGGGAWDQWCHTDRDPPIPGTTPRQPGFLPAAPPIPVPSSPCSTILLPFKSVVPSMEWAVRKLCRELCWGCSEALEQHLWVQHPLMQPCPAHRPSWPWPCTSTGYGQRGPSAHCPLLGRIVF